MKLEEAVQYAGDLLKSVPKNTRVRIIGHVDADGIAAASIVAIAVARAGFRFHISIKRTEPDLVDQIKKEENEFVICADIGSSYLAQMEQLSCPVIVLDHHQYEEDAPSNVMFINALLYGLDGSKEACGSSVAYAFALALDEHNTDLSQLAVSGILGDKQRFDGYNRKILEDGIAKGVIDEQEEYVLRGNSLKEALENSLEPYFSGFSSATPFIERLGLPLHVPLEELDDAQKKKLLSALTLKLLEQGVDNIEWKTIGYHGKKYGDLRDITSKLNACARFNEAGMGVGICLGDEASLKKAHMIQERYRDEIRKEMRKLEQEEPHERSHYLYFYTDKPSLSGVLAGLSLAYLPQFKKGKPVFALAVRNRDSLIDISSRADDAMVEQGLNLGEALRHAAEKVGGMGGGHPIAAGGRIDRKREQEFLEELDRELGP